MLKKKVKELQKELYELCPRETKRFSTKDRKYTLDDWTIDEIKMVVFPEGRDIFDPEDEDLREKWNQTDWLNSSFLKLLSVEELMVIRDWMQSEKLNRRLK